MLDNIRIVLVETSHPGNIGAVARAMKTMDLKHLHLVSPKQFPHPQATAMASNADDILESCTVVSSLSEAIADCQFVYGCTARARDLQWPMLSAEQFAIEAKQHAPKGRIAVVFGRESTGLSNEELWMCQAGVTIPTSTTYRSLNIGQAVQLIAYELFKHLQGGFVVESAVDEVVSMEAMEQFYNHLQQVLIDIEFMRPDEPKRLLPKLRRLFNRSRIQASEMNILRGILTQIQKKRIKHG